MYINADDIKEGVLLSSHEEWKRQCDCLGRIAAISMNSYCEVLGYVDAAAADLPDIEWVQDRCRQARDAVVNGWLDRDD